MQKYDEKKGKNRSFAASLIKGFITGFAVIIIVFFISAMFISLGKVSESAMKAVVWGATFFGSLAGSIVSIKSYGTRALVIGLSVGAAIFVLTLIGSAFSEKSAFIGALTPGTLITLLSGSFSGCLLCTRKKGRRRV